jgi:hypothetical protein
MKVESLHLSDANMPPMRLQDLLWALPVHHGEAFLPLCPGGSGPPDRQFQSGGCVADIACSGGPSAWAGAPMRGRSTANVPGPKIAIKTKQGVRFMDPAEVIAIQAENNQVLIVLPSGSHLVRAAIYTIAEKLRPYGFVQIHRSVLVNASWIQEIRPRSAGEYLVCTRGGQEYAVSRTYRRNLKSLAPLWIGADAFLSEFSHTANANPDRLVSGERLCRPQDNDVSGS